MIWRVAALTVRGIHSGHPEQSNVDIRVEEEGREGEREHQQEQEQKEKAEEESRSTDCLVALQDALRKWKLPDPCPRHPGHLGCRGYERATCAKEEDEDEEGIISFRGVCSEPYTRDRGSYRSGGG